MSINSRTFTSDSDVDSPPEASSITIRCYAEEGTNGYIDNPESGIVSATAGGANGGYAEGDLSTNSGDTLYIRFANGAGGGDAYTDSLGTARGGDGGTGATVRQNGDTASDTVIAAGGGGGGGAAIAQDFEIGYADAGGGGSGGGTASDGEDANPQETFAAGGTGGGQAGINGGGGADVTDNYSSIYAAGAGGGGGGGYNGGQGGGADADANNDEYESAAGAGGGGGDGYIGGVTNATSSTGTKTGSPKVEIEYQKPSAPSNFSVNSVQKDSVDLSWDSVSYADGYRVYRSQTSGSGYSSIGDITTTSFTDSTVDEGIQYHYVVVAYDNTWGESVYSTELTATPPLPAPTQFQVDSTSVNSISASWTLNSADEDEVRAYYQLGTDPFQKDASLSPGTQSHSYTNLLNGRTYSFYVSAWTPDTESDSNTDTATTEVAPINNLSLDSSTTGEIGVTWDSNQNIGQYHLYLQEIDSGDVVDTADVNYDVYSHTFTNVTDGVDYEVGVRVETQDVTGGYTTSSVVSNLPPMRVMNVEYNRAGYVEISMKRFDNLSGGSIEIYRSETEGQLGNKIADIADHTKTSYIDMDVQPMEDYYYTIRRIS